MQKPPTLLAFALAMTLGPATFAAPAHVPATPASLCTASEEVVFGCAQGRKLVSLCAALAASGRTQLRYVYGTKAKLDLEISQSALPDAFSSGVAGLSGGGIDYVRVRNGDFSYVIYTGMTPGWSQEGWIVEAKSAPVSHHICKRIATGANVWGPVYAAKLPKAGDAQRFRPPEWTGAAPPRH